MKIKQVILLCTLPLVLISCMKVKNKDNPDSSAQQQTILTDQQKSQGISYEVLSGEEANSYTYKFVLGNTSSQLFVKKTTTDGSIIQSIQPNANGEWLEQKIPETDQTTYEFGNFQEEQFKSLDKITITKPKDLVLSGLTKWSQIEKHFTADSIKRLHLQKFYRLYLSEKAVLLTEGMNLNLQVKELYSKDAELQTWPEKQKAAAGKEGRSGGQIIINAENAVGRIHLTLRGEDGADGEPGPKDDSLNGVRGADGMPPEVHEQSPTCSWCVPTYTCRKAGTNGLKGGTARTGHKGGPGLRGGNSGFVLFKVSKKFDLIWTRDAIPGLGGYGGRGGPGGLGGLGGKSGNSLLNSSAIAGCAATADGPIGDTGSEGPAGDPGQNGIKELSCFTEGGKSPICL